MCVLYVCPLTDFWAEGINIQYNFMMTWSCFRVSSKKQNDIRKTNPMQRRELINRLCARTGEEIDERERAIT